MKPLQLLSFSAGLVVASVSAPAQLTYEPFANAQNYSIIVRHDATFAGIHVALGGLIGGNLTMKAGANMEFGNRLSDGFALYVGGNIQPLGGGQIALFGNDYHVGGSTGGVTFQNPGAALAVSPLGGSVDSLFSSLLAKSADFNNATSFGAVSATSVVNGNKLTLTVQTGVTNVFNVSTSLASLLGDQNAEVHVSGILDSDTRLIVNYVGEGDASSLTFRAKTLGLGNTTYDQVIWNFSALGTLTFTGDTFHGSIFAPGTAVIWDANDLDGQLVAAAYESRSQREIHAFEFWDEAPPPPPLQFAPVPEPSTHALGAVVLLVGVAMWRRLRPRVCAVEPGAL